jgi:hypothetical protein
MGFLLASALATTSGQGTARRDVVKGLVTTDSGAAVPDADVIVTMLWQPIVTTIMRPNVPGRWGGPFGARWIE